MTQQVPQKLSFWFKLLGGIGVLVLLVIAATQLNLQGVLQDALIWVRSLGALGAIAFIGIYILATVLFVPGSILTLGGGALFGVVWGSVYVFIAATVGAAIAFLVGRYLARDWVAKQIAGNPKFQAIDEAIAKEGFKITLLTRLSPIFPFNLLNYSLGITQVVFKDYLLASIGMAPGTIMYVYFGSLVGDLAQVGVSQTTDPQTQTLRWILNIVGFLATVAVTIYITRIAKQALNQNIP
jgi:uncharacterized membrane protein YdjX (TVP38/TMEM64 family)